MQMTVNRETKHIHVNLGPTLRESDVPHQLRIELPEKFDIDVRLRRGHVRVTGTKLEAIRCHVAVAAGDLSVRKVRAEELSLSALLGELRVESVAEATNMQLAGRVVYGKRISAEVLSIEASGSYNVEGGGGGTSVGASKSPSAAPRIGSSVHVDALYSPSAVIRCTAPLPPPCSPTGASMARSALVYVDALHGALSVESCGGPVDNDPAVVPVPRVPAAAASGPLVAAAARACALSLQRITGQVEARAAAGGIEAHFDVPEGRSTLRADRGPVALLVNHQASANVRLETALPYVVDIKPGACFLDAPADGGDPPPGTASAANVVGSLLPDVARAALESGGSRGKIDIEAARKFTSSTSFFGPAAVSGEADVPEIRASAADGGITLESLSWRDSIRRKFFD
jgi:hypothetical protein